MTTNASRSARVQKNRQDTSLFELLGETSNLSIKRTYKSRISSKKRKELENSVDTYTGNQMMSDEMTSFVKKNWDEFIGFGCTPEQLLSSETTNYNPY